ncbi:hypothetical protein ABPG74_009131 [Tetrahymena malaccensis]
MLNQNQNLLSQKQKVSINSNSVFTDLEQNELNCTQIHEQRLVNSDNQKNNEGKRLVCSSNHTSNIEKNHKQQNLKSNVTKIEDFLSVSQNEQKKNNLEINPIRNNLQMGSFYKQQNCQNDNNNYLNQKFVGQLFGQAQHIYQGNISNQYQQILNQDKKCKENGNKINKEEKDDNLKIQKKINFYFKQNISNIKNSFCMLSPSQTIQQKEQTITYNDLQREQNQNNKITQNNQFSNREVFLIEDDSNNDNNSDTLEKINNSSILTNNSNNFNNIFEQTNKNKQVTNKNKFIQLNLNKSQFSNEVIIQKPSQNMKDLYQKQSQMLDNYQRKEKTKKQIKNEEKQNQKQQDYIEEGPFQFKDFSWKIDKVTNKQYLQKNNCNNLDKNYFKSIELKKLIQSKKSIGIDVHRGIQKYLEVDDQEILYKTLKDQNDVKLIINQVETIRAYLKARKMNVFEVEKKISSDKLTKKMDYLAYNIQEQECIIVDWKTCKTKPNKLLQQSECHFQQQIVVTQQYLLNTYQCEFKVNLLVVPVKRTCLNLKIFNKKKFGNQWKIIDIYLKLLMNALQKDLNMNIYN